MKKRVTKLYNAGDINKNEASLLIKRLEKTPKSGFTHLFKDLPISLKKREDIVFKLITSGMIKDKKIVS